MANVRRYSLLLLAKRGTYKVGVGSLGELVLGRLADVRICRAVSHAAGHGQSSQRHIPGESVPSNTWLMSMTA